MDFIIQKKFKYIRFVFKGSSNRTQFISPLNRHWNEIIEVKLLLFSVLHLNSNKFSIDSYEKFISVKLLKGDMYI